MANFDSPKAAGRNISEPKTPAVAGNKSNQEQMTGAGTKAGPMPSPSTGSTFIKGTQREYSNQVKFSSNPYGSGTIKDALNTYKQTLKAAVVNPGMSDAGSDGRSAGATRKAAGRTAVSGSTPSGF